MKSTIIVNGKEYSSLEDIPEEYKVVFGDKNGGGYVEAILAGEEDVKNPSIHISGSKKINADFTLFFFQGKQYNEINQLPPEAKELVESGLAKLQKTGMKLTRPRGNLNTENTRWTGNGSPASDEVMKEEEAQLSPNFKSRLIITVLLFVMAVIYVSWLLKII